MKSERKEAWMRIVVGFVSGIVIYVWFWFVAVLFIVNWVYAIFSGKKLKEICRISEIFNTQAYTFARYMTFVSNKRPFPFNNLEKEISKIE